MQLTNCTEIKGEKKTPLIFPGMVAVVIKNDYGHQGTGRLIDYADEGEGYYDETQDFCSVIENEFGGKRVIHLEDKDEWEAI